jgi:hypothetical protein
MRKIMSSEFAAPASRVLPAGWPQRWDGKQRMRTGERPTSQWLRVNAGYSDDLSQ